MNEFDHFITTLRMRTPQAVDTGVAKFRTGDIIEFWVDDCGSISTTARENWARCVDVVEQHDGEFYAVDHDTGGGCFLSKVTDSRIVGNIYTSADPLRGLLRFNLFGKLALALLIHEQNNS